MNVTSYIFFDGTCAEALSFYEKALGATIEDKHTYGDTPAAEHVPASLRGKVIHARFRIGDSVVMASDDGTGKPVGRAARFSLSIATTKAAEAQKLFKALAEGGEITMAMDKTFFAERFGSVRDKFGIPWMVICEKDG